MGSYSAAIKSRISKYNRVQIMYGNPETICQRFPTLTIFTNVGKHDDDNGSPFEPAAEKGFFFEYSRI